MKAVHFNFHFSGFQLYARPGAGGEFTLNEDENDGYNYENRARRQPANPKQND